MIDKYADPCHHHRLTQKCYECETTRVIGPAFPAVRALIAHVHGPGTNGPILQEKIDAARRELEKWI